MPRPYRGRRIKQQAVDLYNVHLLFVCRSSDNIIAARRGDQLFPTLDLTENLNHWFGGRIEFNAFNGGVGGTNVSAETIYLRTGFFLS
jgi:hypothetical protein